MNNKTSNIISELYRFGISYPAPTNLTYMWNFGSLALICLIIQFITGIFLAMHYIPINNFNLAFESVEHIMRNVNYGWLLRYTHMNGASAFFFVVYIHMFRGLYYASYQRPRYFLWCTGVILLLLMILTAFMGYVLPWGQMSYWAATVITNFVSVVPFIGIYLLEWIWGNFSVNGDLINRFFSLHYLFPFLILGFVILHLILLHDAGSSNPLGIVAKKDTLRFYNYFIIKDLFGITVFFLIFSYFLFFDPNLAGHPDNYIEANPMVTPKHIVPEWYFLPFYGILRSIKNKILGIIALLFSIIILIIFPLYVEFFIRSNQLKFIHKFFFWSFFFNFLLLGWIGSKTIEYPYDILSKFCTIFYFVYFIVILPFLQYLENMVYFIEQDEMIKI
jgi:ubiquinol-cytochrome c reductase cytochrome b/c1 subunit